MTKTTLLTAALLAHSAYAACPNACSGHGACGQYDSCVCHQNFVGHDCSQRQCMYNKAWITTATGDLNFDGDRLDSTIYADDTYFTETSVEHVVTQHQPGGHWESWPSTFSSTNDEGHFYMECSNRGLCDRKVGECECFEGYTGEACRRTTCPDGCSGHGRCLTVEQHGALAGFTYDLWDHDMSRSCQCDPGYAGINCGNRLCPVGDDPLTTDQQHTTQFAEIYLNTGADFGGQATITVTAHDGHEYTSDPFTVAPYSGSNTGTAANAKVALESLPNDVITGLTITEGYCSTVIAGTGTFDSATTFVAGTNNGFTRTMATGEAFVCPSATSNDVLLYDTALTDAAGTAYTATTGEDDLTCYLLTKQYCNRLTIKFTDDALAARGGSTGAMALLQFNTDSVTDTATGEKDDNALDNFQTSVDVTYTLSVAEAATAGVTVEYVAKATDDKSCSAGSCSITASTKTITLDAGGDSFGSSTSERIKVWCGSTKLIGTFTVASAGATSVVVSESIADCAGTTGNEVIVKRVTDYLVVNSDITGLISAGDFVTYFDGGVLKGVSRAVLSTHWSATVGSAFIYLDNSETEGTSKDFATSDISVSTAGTTSGLFVYGQGTSESTECSDRGLCDSESGICDCYIGYTGYACDLQNSLVA